MPTATKSPRFRDRFRAALPPWARDLRDLLGDDEAATTYSASLIAYVGDGATAQSLLDRLISAGPPDAASAALLLPSSSLEPQTLLLPTTPTSEPATAAAPDGRVDFGAPF